MKNVPLNTILLVMLVGGLGCQAAKTSQSTPDLRDKLQSIDTVQLGDLSETEPISVAEATEQMTAEVADGNQVHSDIFLTLAEVRAATLANNLSLQVALVEPSLSRTYLDEQRAKFESVFYGDADLRRVEGIDTGKVTKTQTYEAGITKPLPTGGSFSVGVPISDVDATDAEGVSEARLSIAYYQSLMRGAGTSINTQSIRIAQLSNHILDARTQLRALRLLAQADQTYWRVYAARKELEVRREQYKLAEDQLNQSKKMVAAGAAARIEIVRAEAGLAGRLESLINAETSLQTWERDLRRMMNRSDMPINSPISFLPQSHPQPRGLELDRDKLIDYALDHRMDMIELEQYLAIDDLDIAMAHNQRLPDVGFSAQLNTRNQGDAWVDTYHRFSHKQYNDWSLGLSATVPLGNRAAEARLRRAKLARLQDRLQREDLSQLIQTEVEEAVNNLRGGWRRILAANQGIIAADRDYQVEQSQFQLGRRNSTDVLFAASRLGEAQLTRIRAYVDYEIAQIYLAQATGTLLGLGRVQIEPVQLSLHTP